MNVPMPYSTLSITESIRQITSSTIISLIYETFL
jgi:hypothetical protein